MNLHRAAAAMLAASLGAVVWLLGGATAAIYLAVYLAATLPGLPLGFMLFGARHAGGWIAGMLLGYAITTLACWTMIFTGHASGPAFIAAWLFAALVPWAVYLWRERHGILAPLAPLPRWTSQDTAALALVLLLVPALTGPAFARVGSYDAEGNRRFRAYFTADFVWHMALVAELKKHEQPPRNPYLASERIHYYWDYFIVPAAAGPLSGADVDLSLKINAVATAMLFVSAMFLAAWVALPGHPRAVAGAMFLTVVAGSPEGLAAIAYLLAKGQSLEWLRDLNIDALPRAFGGLRVDNLPRAMWYVPQHAMAYALGLVAVPVVAHRGVRAVAGARLLAGTALGASVMLNPLVGAIFCAVYGATVIADAWRSRAGIPAVLSHGIAVIPVALALAWIRLNQITDGVAGVLQFGLAGPAANAPIASFVLSYGLLLGLMVVGLVPHRGVPFRPALPAAIGIILSVLVMHLVVMTIDEFWVGFRTGHLIFACAPALVGRGLAVLSRRGERLAWSAAALVLVTGLPTTAIDMFNAQDVENDRMGPGFHWTVRITPAEQEALAWIRDRTALDAIVQADPTVRGRETWSLIPTWAERRMAAGLPISLMHTPAYDLASDEVRRIYQDADPVVAWQRARALRIDYLYVDRIERQAYSNAAKFDESEDLFHPIFRNDEVAIYQIGTDSARADR